MPSSLRPGGAIFPDLAPKTDLAPALALNGIEFNLARAIGPGLAGLVIAAAGVGIAFVLNAIFLLGVIFVIARNRGALASGRRTNLFAHRKFVKREMNPERIVLLPIAIF
jgi:MFS family permease